MNKEILVFKRNADGKVSSKFAGEYTLKIWKPGIFKYIPPNKDYKYFMYWLFHFCRIFKNSCYSAYLLYKNSELVSSCLIIPSHFKWPFMKSKDVQFTYVMTSEEYRGRGIAGKLIEISIADLNQRVNAFWYVTDTENEASIRVAEKMDFRCIGKAEKTNVLKKIQIMSL